MGKRPPDKRDILLFFRYVFLQQNLWFLNWDNGFQTTALRGRLGMDWRSVRGAAGVTVLFMHA